jgi:Nif-specific regulatory protein
MERDVIVEELKRARGNMAQAARSLGITERMIGLRVVKYKIDTTRFK